MALVADLRRGVINTIAASHLTPAAIRYRLLRAYGVKLDRSVVLRTGFYVDGPNLEIGAGTFINVGCYFDGSAPISIGSDCDIAAEVMFCTSTHALGAPARRAGQPTVAGIVVGDGCWIGTRATLLPGVSVAPGCIVAAGAVLTRDTRPDGLYGGVPAVLIRDLAASPADGRSREPVTVSSPGDSG
jgi:maltose O-acetyltransferase